MRAQFIRSQVSLSQKFRKSNVILLIVIAAAAAILLIISYQYSTYNANEILKIASDDVRSNADIQAHHLSTIVEQELDKVTAILQTLATAPAIHNGEIQLGRDIINLRQEATSNITDGYFWLDKEGKLMWSSKFANNQSLYEQFNQTNLRDQVYFTTPQGTGTTYYSSVIESLEGIPNIYVSMPIIGEGANNDTTVFEGVIVAGMRTDTVGNFLKNQIPSGFESDVGLLDKNGIIVYTNNQTNIGKDYFSEELQSSLSVILSPKELVDLNNILQRSLRGDPGREDITAIGRTTTIAYRPVMVNGEHLLTLYITSPHQLTGSVNLAIDQQRYFNLVIIGSIGALAIGIACLILTWNRKLEKTVDAKTAELRQANEQLKIHDRMQKEFINVAAHELRTPIVPILGFGELLYSKIKGRQQQQKGQGQQEEEEMVETILRNANRLHQLTEDILDVTRIESNTLKLKKERFNLNDVIVDAIEDFREQIANGKVNLMYEPGNNNTFVVEADRRRVTQVISNLLNNSIKFTKEGTVTVATIVRRKDVVDRDNRGEGGGSEEVVIATRDTGSGIDPELMPRLFTKFATKSYQGTGLGLFISKSIVEAHGGKIWAENNNNNGSDSDRKYKGATFYFTLPVVAMSEERREEKKQVRLVNDKLQ